MKVAGFTGPQPNIPKVVTLKAIKESRLFAAQLELWANLPRLRRILVAHGEDITHDPPAVLRSLAARLT